MDTIILMILGILLRIGIPVAVTAVVFHFLRRLDDRWQKESLEVPVIALSKPCWEIKGCSEEKRKNCAAFSKSPIPCWQVFRSKKGLVREECLGCEVFRMAPIPARI